MDRNLTSSIAFAVICGIASPLFAQELIGVASVVKNEVSGTIGGQTQVIGRGAQVFKNEVVTTGTNSTAQLLFRDQTVLTIGADARVILDRFVYDPQTRAGDIVVNIAKGAFRFVSGNARSESYKIKTPAATISVRGTMFSGWVNPADNTMIITCMAGTIAIQQVSQLGLRLPPVVLSPGNFITYSNGEMSRPKYINDKNLNNNNNDINGALNNAAVAMSALGLRAAVKKQKIKDKTLADNKRLQNIVGVDPRIGTAARPDINDAADSRDIKTQFPVESYCVNRLSSAC